MHSPVKKTVPQKINQGLTRFTYFKVINLNAKKPKIRLTNKEKLEGIIKPHKEIIPPTKKFIKWVIDTTIKIIEAILIT